jgi:hypothetical protein
LYATPGEQTATPGKRHLLLSSMPSLEKRQHSISSHPENIQSKREKKEESKSPNHLISKDTSETIAKICQCSFFISNSEYKCNFKPRHPEHIKLFSRKR